MTIFDILAILPILVSLILIYNIVKLELKSRRYKKTVKHLEKSKPIEIEMFTIMLKMGLINEFNPNTITPNTGFVLKRKDCVSTFSFDYRYTKHVDMYISMRNLDTRKEMLDRYLKKR